MKKRGAERYAARFPIRLAVLGAFWLVACGMVVGRVFHLQITQKNFLQAQGDVRTIREVPIPAYRGVITDRHHDPVAISTPVGSVWINPRVFPGDQAACQALGRVLNMPAAMIQQKWASHADREFIYLKRHLDPDWAQMVSQLGLPGVFVQREYKRYYPMGEVMGQVLGFTNIDDQGQEGLELAYESVLQGIPGVKRVIKDRMGRVVADVASVREPQSGKTLALTLDKRIQYVAYRALKAAVARHQAKGGSVVVFDPDQGDILAMVNQPAFNPNAREKSRPDQFRNRAVTDSYEPGSVMKILSMAAILEAGQFGLNHVVHTEPGWTTIGKHTVRDIRNYGPLDLTGVIVRSSNVGISQLVLAIPPADFLSVLRRLGLGQSTGSGYPGETTGVFEMGSQVSAFVRATVSFGYAITATPLQIARAYGAIATGGCLPTPRFIKSKVEPASCHRVLSPQTADTLLRMLEAVVTDGGAKRAAIPGYRVGGKTGTARRVGKQGYEKRYNAWFAGIAPLDGRRLVGVVLITDPEVKRGYYGSEVAAPVFAEVMQGAARMMGMVPRRSPG